MDFDLSEEQELLRKTAREFLTAECSTRVVRSAEETGTGFSRELWQKMTDLGWAGLPVPEALGGSGARFFDMCLLMEEIGRALAPVPLSSVALCEYALMEAAGEEQKKEILPALALGKWVMTPAIHEPTFSFDAGGIRTRAARSGDRYVLNGIKLLVPFGAIADAYLVPARTGEPEEHGISLFIVDRKRPGVTVAVVPTIACDGRAEVQLTEVLVGRESLVGREGDGWPILKKLMQRGAIFACAEMVGGAQAVLEKTVEYVKQRVQFGRPVGSFQAIQHKCANMAIACDGMRFITYEAAWRCSEGLPFDCEVAMAKAWVSDAYTWLCLESHQVHGAIAFTREYDLQLYTRRAKAAELAYGDSRHYYEELAEIMGL